ncbi:MAG TPA: hydrolase [Thermodesulfobacteriota bacterium]|nr:hydrolase [Thermodesulfobacteriota bacterium]
MNREQSVLVAIDFQEAQTKIMPPEMAKNLIRNIKILIAFAKHLKIPILATEQYPKGLGRTIPEIREELGTITPIEKVSFSCCGVRTFNEQLEEFRRSQIILTGIEAHVCVLQTARDLIQRNYEVHVAADAIGSRKKLDWEVALRWMEKKGAMISTTEIIAFQLLKEAGTDDFKQLSKYLK